MKKLTIITIFLLALACGANHAFAVEDKISHPQAEWESIRAVMEDIEAATEAGDAALVSKLLASAITSYPRLAEKIVAAFVARQSEAAAPAAKTINTAAVIQNVLTSLQNQQGSEALVAAVLGTYTPASGRNNESSEGRGNSGENGRGNRPNLPPELPPAGQLGGDKNNSPNGLPKENPHQTSAH